MNEATGRLARSAWCRSRAACGCGGRSCQGWQCSKGRAATSVDLPTPPVDGHFFTAHIAAARDVELNAAHLSNQEMPAQFSLLLREFLHPA